MTIMLARSTDGGEAWKVEDGGALNAEDAVPVPIPGNIRFTHRILLCAAGATVFTSPTIAAGHGKGPTRC